MREGGGIKTHKMGRWTFLARPEGNRGDSPRTESIDRPKFQGGGPFWKKLNSEGLRCTGGLLPLKRKGEFKGDALPRLHSLVCDLAAREGKEKLKKGS